MLGDSIVKVLARALGTLVYGDGETQYVSEDAACDDIERTLRDMGVEEMDVAVERLLAKLDQVAKDTQGIFAMAHIHGQDYKGANWGEEYKTVREALAKVRSGKG